MYKGWLDSFEMDQRISSHFICVLSWHLANSWISFQELCLSSNLLGYCYCYSNLEEQKARTTGPFYIEHIVSNPSSSPCPLKYFIAAQPVIRLASNLNQFVSITYLYNLSLHNLAWKPLPHFPIKFYSLHVWTPAGQNFLNISPPQITKYIQISQWIWAPLYMLAILFQYILMLLNIFWTPQSTQRI